MSDLKTPKEILLDEISIAHEEHIAKMPHLEDWIIDAMNHYANYKVRQATKQQDSAVLMNISGNEVAVCRNIDLENEEDCKIEHCCFKCNLFY